MPKGIKKENLAGEQSSNELMVAEKSDVVNFNAETLIAQAIDKNVPVETMEKLLAMRRELKEEWAKEQYNRAMAKFQSECPTIVKTKEVHTKNGDLAYKYAPIESIVEQVKPFLQTNGFSYSTSMEVLPAGVKVTCKVIHADGHSESSEMEVPLGNQTQIMSASQVTAAASTFAKRYAFCNAFGILTGDEDNDARPMEVTNVKPAPTPALTKVNPKGKSGLFESMINGVEAITSLPKLEDAMKQITMLKSSFSTTELSQLRTACAKKKQDLELPVIQHEIEEATKDIQL